MHFPFLQVLPCLALPSPYITRTSIPCRLHGQGYESHHKCVNELKTPIPIIRLAHFSYWTRNEVVMYTSIENIDRRK